MDERSSAVWREYLEHPALAARGERVFMRLLPSEPRCKMCNSPFGGVGGGFMRLIGRRPWPKNPRYCNVCVVAIQDMPGGAEIELSMLFADVRGSTSLAERLGTTEFARVMNRFASVGTRVVIDHDGIVEKFIGDQIAALFTPGFAGPAHARVAIETAQRLLEATSGGTVEFTALGDAVNTTARLSTAARPGEILVSEAACAAAGLAVEGLERRELQLKGKTETFAVRVLGTTSEVRAA